MKPPDRETTRKALALWDYPSPRSVEVEDDVTLVEAARAWSRIAADATGEWSDEVVEFLAKTMAQYAGYGGLGPGPEYWLGMAKAVLAEIVRLAEGSD